MADSTVDAIKAKVRKIRAIQQSEAEKIGQRNGLKKRLKDEFDVDSQEAGADLLEENIKTVESNDKSLLELDGELHDILEMVEKKTPETPATEA